VTRNDAAKPATLRADVDYAICEKLCVPVEAKLELPLQTTPTNQSPRLRQTETLVPRRVPLGAPGSLAIISVRRVSEPKPHVVVDVAAPADAKVDLLAEGPTAEWALPLPQPVAGAPGGAQRFAFALDGLPAGASAAGAMLTLTAMANGRAIEVTAPLD
jgi:DsbC/DsbD-like thiol-disulfide interchange protein